MFTNLVNLSWGAKERMAHSLACAVFQKCIDTLFFCFLCIEVRLWSYRKRKEIINSLQNVFNKISVPKKYEEMSFTYYLSLKKFSQTVHCQDDTFENKICRDLNRCEGSMH